MVYIDEENLNPVIERSLKIAVHYLRSNYQKVIKLLNFSSLSYEDIAIDAIASLFSGNSNFELPVKTSFKNWQPPIETEEEFIFFLSKVVINRVEQHITKLLKESDPLFDTLLTSVNYLIRRNKYGKSKYLGTVYILESGTKKINGKVIDLDSFNKLPGSMFIENKKVLQNLFIFIKNETDFFPAIPLNALVLRFKEIKTYDFKSVDKVESRTKSFEINESLNKVLKSLKVRLDNSYIKKGKLSEAEAQKIFAALKDISEDLKNGGINPGLYEYLKPHFDELTNEVYLKKYHNILEYLVKVMKNNIAKELIQ